ncbi:probable G-protein coupled receptor 160 [Nannospalax galili]|uniref:probable G-protein coupled receptor 160 n=1 Tax=Nannospalax galili TaxID=1026970 RepID=UPI0004ED11BD|nr:probable G-protein coupled receptor 160 [Nannospalax galili]XP_029417924.1 probable G-protein coupled receptor 160 [Nannospalax galili]
MTALSPENCSSQHWVHPSKQPPDVNCVLFLIVLGKILLNILTLGMKRKSIHQSFMEYFCMSLALADLFLLVNISILSYFRDFVLLGIRFTKYHICLLTQIVSFTYGFLHYPVFLIACVDHCFNLSKTTKLPSKCQKLFYFLTVILLWTAVLAYVLGDPAIAQSMKSHSVYFYQCPSYVSIQSYWLSWSMLTVLLVALLVSWSEVITLIQAVRIASYMNETILYFPFSPYSGDTVSSRKILSSKLLVCFLGTWLPFVVLQVLTLSLGARVPAYIEMNVPWLYFVNSFLVAAVYWCSCHKLYLSKITLPKDPFVNWKCCFVPFTIHGREQMERPASVIIC